MILLDYLRTQMPGGDDSATAEAYNALPDHHAEVPARSVAAWLGGDARLRRLKAFAAAPTPPELDEAAEPLWTAAQSGVEALLLAMGTEGAAVLLCPGSNERTLLDGLVSLEVLTAAEAASLIARGLPAEWEPATAQDVAAARQQLTRMESAAAADADNARAKLRADRINALAAVTPGVSPAVLPLPVPPAGYRFDAAGELVEDAGA